MEKTEQREEFKKRIRLYIIRLVRFLGALPGNPMMREINSQLMRSGTSIGANYFEALAASSKKDFQNFFNHSLKSANESKFWLSVLIDAKMVPEEAIGESHGLLQETKELANIFASSIITMKNKK